MQFFPRRSQWVESFKLQSLSGPGRGFLKSLFWLWGAGGLVLLSASIGGLTGNIGVGTSAYLTTLCLLWIGGMVLFGFGALLGRLDFIAKKPSTEYDDGDIRVGL